MNTDFENLINGLCALTGFPSPQHLIEGGGVEFHGVSFALTQKTKTDPDGLFVHADFGQLDLEQQAALYPLMLQENLMMMMTSRDCTFSVSRSLDSVVMIERVALSTQTPDTLLALLRSLARRSNYFNKHHRAGKSLSPSRRPPAAGGYAMRRA